MFTGGGDGQVKRWHLDKGCYACVASHRPRSPHDSGRNVVGVDAEKAGGVPGAGSAASGRAKDRAPPRVRRESNEAKMLSGFESMRSTGAAGVVDLMLHPLDAPRFDHVIVGMGFAQLLVVDLTANQTPKAETLATAHHGPIHALACHPRVNVFATVGLDCLLFLWDADETRVAASKSLRTGGTAVAIRGPRKPASKAEAASAPSEDHVAVGCNDGGVEVFAFPSLEARFSIPATAEAAACATYSPNGRILAVGSHDNSVYLHDAARDYRCRRKLSGHSSYVKNADFSFDSRLLQTSCGAYEIMRVWPRRTFHRERSATDQRGGAAAHLP